jgi:hypothetical protein
MITGLDKRFEESPGLTKGYLAGEIQCRPYGEESATERNRLFNIGKGCRKKRSEQKKKRIEDKKK